MILDSQEIFSAQQTPTSSSSDTPSVNVLDVGAAVDQGVGEPIYLTVKCNTTATSGGSATIAAVLQTSADNITFNDVVIGRAWPVASVVAGFDLLKQVLPTGLKRYIRVVYRIATADLTAGRFDAYLSTDIQANTPYPSAFTVDA